MVNVLSLFVILDDEKKNFHALMYILSFHTHAPDIMNKTFPFGWEILSNFFPNLSSPPTNKSNSESECTYYGGLPRGGSFLFCFDVVERKKKATTVSKALLFCLLV